MVILDLKCPKCGHMAKLELNSKTEPVYCLECMKKADIPLLCVVRVTEVTVPAMAEMSLAS